MTHDPDPAAQAQLTKYRADKAKESAPPAVKGGTLSELAGDYMARYLGETPEEREFREVTDRAKEWYAKNFPEEYRKEQEALKKRKMM